MPDVPTLQEAGLKGVVLESWYAAFAPLGTPPAVIARLNADEQGVADQASRDNCCKTATEAVGGTPERARQLGACGLGEVCAADGELNIRAG